MFAGCAEGVEVVSCVDLGVEGGVWAVEGGVFAEVGVL